MRLPEQNVLKILEAMMTQLFSYKIENGYAQKVIMMTDGDEIGQCYPNDEGCMNENLYS